MEEEVVVLVDAADNVIGEAPKMRAHQEGRLHRAISVFLFNEAGEMLLQQRAEEKYHSPSLWSNSCCTHPRVGESPRRAALRRLAEEMGISCSLEHAFSFLYRADLGSGLIEHELDHVFIGRTDEEPRPDPAEVQAWRWVSPSDLVMELKVDPSRFTVWFPLALERMREHLHEDQGHRTTQ